MYVENFCFDRFGPKAGERDRSVLRIMPGFGSCATIVPLARLMKYCGGSIASVNWPRTCFLDGTLELAAFDPLPSEMDPGP